MMWYEYYSTNIHQILSILKTHDKLNIPKNDVPWDKIELISQIYTQKI